MPDTITAAPDARAADIGKPAFCIVDLTGDLADHVATLSLAIGGLRAECGRGHDRSFDAVEMLAQEVLDYAEALKAWANGRRPEWKVGDRADRLLAVVSQLEAAAAAKRAK